MDISAITKLDTPTFTTPQYLNYIDDYVSTAEVNEQVGLEKLSTIPIKIVDSFLGILSNITTGLSGLLDKGKIQRSEFKQYCDDNKLITKKLLSLKYTSVYETEIPVIKGFLGRYPDIAFELQKLLDQFDMPNRCDAISDAIKAISLEVQKPKPNIGKSLTMANNVFDSSIRGKLKKILAKNFDIKDTTLDVEFSKQFKSMGEFIKLFDDMTTLTDKYNEFLSVVAKLEEIQAQVDNLIELIEERSSAFSTKDIKALSTIVHSYAGMFDMYAIAIARFNNIEHNFTYVCKSLVKAHL